VKFKAETQPDRAHEPAGFFAPSNQGAACGAATRMPGFARASVGNDRSTDIGLTTTA
jgi:hypothetical protein